MAILFPELLRWCTGAGRRIALGLAATVMIPVLTGASGTIPAAPGKTPGKWDADTGVVDYKARTLHLHGHVKIYQSDTGHGDISVAADDAAGNFTSQDSKNSHWVFTSNVAVRAESQGDLHADRATVEITNGELASALVSGSPAQFQQTRATAGRLVKGHAASINYDVAAGTVRLMGDKNGDAWLSDDQSDNVNSPSITYNVRDQRIEAEGNPAIGGQVHMSVTPKAEPGTSSAPGADHDTNGAPGKP